MNTRTAFTLLALSTTVACGQNSPYNCGVLGCLPDTPSEEGEVIQHDATDDSEQEQQIRLTAEVLPSPSIYMPRQEMLDMIHFLSGDHTYFAVDYILAEEAIEVDSVTYEFDTDSGAPAQDLIDYCILKEITNDGLIPLHGGLAYIADNEVTFDVEFDNNPSLVLDCHIARIDHVDGVRAMMVEISTDAQVDYNGTNMGEETRTVYIAPR